MTSSLLSAALCLTTTPFAGRCQRPECTIHLTWSPPKTAAASRDVITVAWVGGIGSQCWRLRLCRVASTDRWTTRADDDLWVGERSTRPPPTGRRCCDRNCHQGDTSGHNIIETLDVSEFGSQPPTLRWVSRRGRRRPRRGRPRWWGPQTRSRPRANGREAHGGCQALRSTSDQGRP